MMLNKIIDFLYPKVFVNIIASSETSTVFVEIFYNGKIETQEEVFDTNSINSSMLEYIQNIIEQTPYFYISILDKAMSQGMIPTCKDMKKYIDSSNINTICESEKYSYYTSQYDLKEIKNEYKIIGLDFVFSPFSILDKFFADKMDDNLAIFLLIENDSISLSVFDNAKLLFAQRLNMQDEVISDDSGDINIEEDDDESFDLESVNLDIEGEDDSSIEDFGDIEDLDSGLEIDEFSEEEDDSNVEESDDNISDDDTINNDYQRFTLIQSAINYFYKDDKYDSEFIEKIYIADSIGISNDLKRYLEEEMFLNVVVRKIDLAQELSDIAKRELA